MRHAGGHRGRQAAGVVHRSGRRRLRYERLSAASQGHPGGAHSDYRAGGGLRWRSRADVLLAIDGRGGGKHKSLQPWTDTPNITAIGGAYTENGTWGAGLAHFHTWRGDSIRYLGALAKVDANLDYFGLRNQPRAYALRGVALLQQVLFRLGNSPWYLGPRYMLFDSSATFRGNGAPELGSIEKDQRIGKGGVVLDYDTRDNIFYPGRGVYAEVEMQFARGGFGSTQSFDTYDARAFTWLPVARTLILGLRADTRFSSGDIPFYAQPFVDLRGVQKGRYQDRNAVVAEVELRWDMTPRWSLLAFSGVGRAYGRWYSFSDASTVASVGTGFRYLIARKLGLSMGIDVAHSRDQNAFYIQIGSAWH